ncbi:MAG: hypothetical protein QME66_04510 [Candidatus Eisenbacteria bacterium]|nr:hypothetical protein [Candidatus Eisenbacteria bacterium]
MKLLPLFASLCILLWMTVSAVSQENVSTSSESYERGIKLLEEKRFAEASGVLKEALANGADSSKVARPLAEALRYSGDIDGAFQLYGFLAARDSTDMDSRFWVATFLRWESKFDLSIPEYEKLLKAMPTHGDALFGVALALNATGRNDEAIRRLEELKRSVPKYLDARMALARFYREKGRDVDAMKEYTEILSISTTYAPARDELGQLRRELSPAFEQNLLVSEYRTIEGRQDPRSYKIRYFLSEARTTGTYPINSRTKIRAETKRGSLSQENPTFGFTYYDLSSAENVLGFETKVRKLGSIQAKASIIEYTNRGSAASLSGKKSFGTFNVDLRSDGGRFSASAEGKPILVRGARNDAYWGIYRIRTFKASTMTPYPKGRFDLSGMFSKYSDKNQIGSGSISAELGQKNYWIRGLISRWPLELRGLQDKRMRFGYVTTTEARSRYGFARGVNLWTTLWLNSYCDANREAGAFIELNREFFSSALVVKARFKKTSYTKIASDYMAIGETTGSLSVESRGKLHSIVAYYVEVEEFLRKDVITSSSRGENVYFEFKPVGKSRLDFRLGGTGSSNTIGERGGRVEGFVGIVF